jgi:FkbM family methyltransferase
MSRFIFNKAFRRELRGSPHHYGEVAFLESVLQPGMAAIEAGANRGVTAVAMAKTVGRTGHVYAFEPVPEYFEALQANLALNKATHVTAYNFAISDRAGPLTFYKHGEGSGITAFEGAEDMKVAGVSLPEFLSARRIPRVDFINMDCEGSELLIFRNAAAWLKKETPAIFCEVHRQYMKTLGHSVDDAVAFLSELGYDVKPIQVEDGNAPSDFERCSHIYATPLRRKRQNDNEKKEAR